MRTGHSCKIDGSFQAMDSRRRGFQGSLATVVARTTPTFSQVACGATTKSQFVIRPAPASTTSRTGFRPGCWSPSSHGSHSRGRGRGDSRGGPSFGERSGSPWREQSPRETSRGSSEGREGKIECAHQCADRVHRKVFGACSQTVAERQRRSGQSRCEEERVFFTHRSSRASVGAVAHRDSNGERSPWREVELQGKIDELIRERDALRAGATLQGDPSATVPASGAEELNLLRSTVDSLQRERELLRAEVARQRAVVDQSTVMATLIVHGELLARESVTGNRFNPLS